MDSLPVQKVYELAAEAVHRMKKERGADFRFPFDEIWGYASEEIPSTRRPAAARWLRDNGYIVPTGKMTNAATEARAGSKTPEYRFGRGEGDSGAKGSVAGIVESFAAALEDELEFDQNTITRFLSALLAKRFLILTGLSGSGKTKLAQAFAQWITPLQTRADPFKVGTRIRGAQQESTVVSSNPGAVVIRADDGKLIPLPRMIIEEWADFIEKNQISDAIGGRELRDRIEKQSQVSGYLHRLESHYKPAAFALVDARRRPRNQAHYQLVPVGADWTASDNILGYPDGLAPGSYITTPALELILQATESPSVPHFLILDEMNLSHVERYFADFLSAIESGDRLSLYPGDMNDPDRWRTATSGNRIPPSVEKLPENLFIIGTVNVDETTYMFSPKVLDRANVIEFRMPRDDLERFLLNPGKPDLTGIIQRGHDEGFGEALVEKAADTEAMVPEVVKGDYEREMLVFFDVLKEHGAEFGYRTAHEAARFVHFYKLLSGYADADSEWFPEAFDCVIVQKFLPKLHGSRAKLGPLLKALWFLCVTKPDARGEKPIQTVQEAARSTDPKNDPSTDKAKDAPYSLSADKIARMWRLLKENGFASFAEA